MIEVKNPHFLILEEIDQINQAAGSSRGKGKISLYHCSVYPAITEENKLNTLYLGAGMFTAFLSTLTEVIGSTLSESNYAVVS